MYLNGACQLTDLLELASQKSLQSNMKWHSNRSSVILAWLHRIES